MQQRMSSINDNMQSRNRRMFGNLLGHLNQAKTILTKDQSLFDRQRKLEMDVKERERKESEIIRSVQNQVKKEQADKEFSRLNELQTEERILRLKKTLENRCNGYRTLGKYCLTNSKPCVYWLPAKGNEKTEEYAERSRKSMEEKCEEEKKRIDSEVEAVKVQAQQKIENRKKMEEEKEKEKEEEKKKMEEEEEEAPKVDSKMLNLESGSEEEEEEKMEEEKMEEEKEEKKEEEEKMEEEEEKKEEKKEDDREVKVEEITEEEAKNGL